MTVSGRTCQRWDSQSPHTHSYNSDSQFPDETVSAAADYCRNPAGAFQTPWCYTMEAHMEYCYVPFCPLGKLKMHAVRNRPEHSINSLVMSVQ